MARLYMTKANEVAHNGQTQCLVLGGDETYESVAIGLSAASSAAIAEKFVELTAGADCHVAFSTTAVKTSGSEVGVRFAAGQSKVYRVNKPGETTISVIESA